MSVFLDLPIWDNVVLTQLLNYLRVESKLSERIIENYKQNRHQTGTVLFLIQQIGKDSYVL